MQPQGNVHQARGVIAKARSVAMPNPLPCVQFSQRTPRLFLLLLCATLCPSVLPQSWLCWRGAQAIQQLLCKEGFSPFATELQLVSISVMKKSLFAWNWHDRGRFMNTPGLVVLASS